MDAVEPKFETLGVVWVVYLLYGSQRLKNGKSNKDFVLEGFRIERMCHQVVQAEVLVHHGNCTKLRFSPKSPRLPSTLLLGICRPKQSRKPARNGVVRSHVRVAEDGFWKQKHCTGWQIAIKNDGRNVALDEESGVDLSSFWMEFLVSNLAENEQGPLHVMYTVFSVTVHSMWDP